MFWQCGFWSNECTEHSTCTHIYRPPSGITHLELVQSTLTRFIIIPNADTLAFAWESGGESERNHQPRVFTNPGLERPSERRLINVVGEFLAGVRGFMSIVAASLGSTLGTISNLVLIRKTVVNDTISTRRCSRLPILANTCQSEACDRNRCVWPRPAQRDVDDVDATRRRSERGNCDDLTCIDRAVAKTLFTFPVLQTMEAAPSYSGSKHERSHDKDRDSGSRKRAKHKHSKKSSRKNENHLHVVDDDIDDEDTWVEKNVDMDGEKVLSDGSNPLTAD